MSAARPHSIAPLSYSAHVRRREPSLAVVEGGLTGSVLLSAPRRPPAVVVSSRLRARLLWGAFIALLLVCGYFLFGQNPAPELFHGSDKVGHAGGFFVLVMLGFLATGEIGRAFLLILIGLLTLAAGSELIQQTALLPLRTSDVGDLAADLGGCIAALCLIAVLETRRTRSYPSTESWAADVNQPG
jgi:VanZ family protein